MSDSNELNAPMLNLATSPPNYAEIDAKGLVFNAILTGIRARIGCTLSIYFFDGWTKQKRDAILQIADAYLKHVQGTKLFLQTEGKRGKKFSTENWELFAKKAKNLHENEQLYFSLQGDDGKNTYDMRQHFFMVFGFAKNSTTRRLSVLRMYLPSRDCLENCDHFAEQFGVWSGMLEAAHGCAGLGVQSAPSVVISDGVAEFPALKAYPALDFDDVGTFLSEIRFSEDGYQKIRQSNWLTCIHDNFVEELGGERALAALRRAGVSVARFGSAIVLRAGTHPELRGDTADGIPPLFRVVSQFIRPIRFENYAFSLFATPDGIDSKLATREWVCRFD